MIYSERPRKNSKFPNADYIIAMQSKSGASVPIGWRGAEAPLTVCAGQLGCFDQRSADSDEVARAFRDDATRGSDAARIAITSAAPRVCGWLLGRVVQLVVIARPFRCDAPF